MAGKQGFRSSPIATVATGQPPTYAPGIGAIDLPYADFTTLTTGNRMDHRRIPDYRVTRIADLLPWRWHE